MCVPHAALMLLPDAMCDGTLVTATDSDQSPIVNV